MPTTIGQDFFFALCDNAFSQLRGDEVLLCGLATETTDFVRYNQGKVRQPGCVMHASLQLRLIRGSRHASYDVTLTGRHEEDQMRLRHAITQTRELLDSTPEDPFLLYNTDVRSSEQADDVSLPSAEDAIETICKGASNADLVGIWASGELSRGFANSLGQRNWHSTSNFNFDFSIYDQTDKAVKSSYAGKHWDASALLKRLEQCKAQSQILAAPPKTIAPGGYRVFLAPAAIWEILGLLAWEAFSAEEQHAKRSPLMRAVEKKASLSSKINLRENVAGGAGANFDALGFMLPDSTTLFENGRYHSPLVSPRSAKQFGFERNCGDKESPSSLEMDGGELEQATALQALDTGIYVTNLWYLNYSDRAACRLTGMTRFATLWVEGGEPRAPLNVMRLDDSLYRMFGENLIDLTREHETLLDPTSYDWRSTESARLPGALLSELQFTL